MAEEHPKATFTWRKTTWKNETLYTLMGWENVLSKEDLPPEYTEWNTARFWAVGDKIRIPGKRDGLRSAIPQELCRGQVFVECDYAQLTGHLLLACEWLRRTKLKVSESEEIVMEIEALPNIFERHTIPTVVHDTEVVVIGKPTLLERVRRMIQEVKL